MPPKKGKPSRAAPWMGRAAQLTALGVAGMAGPAIAFTQIEDPKARALIATSALVAAAGFLVTRWLIPHAAAKMVSRGICGKDLNKKGTPAGDALVPEAAGLSCGCCFLLCVIAFELLHAYDIGSLVGFVASGFQPSQAPRLEQTIADSWLVDYNAALATIGFMLFLGFVDDVLDLRWRVKLLLPTFAALPLLVAYSGGTGVAVPKPLQAWLQLPHYVELGLLYKGYMVALAIFCTNSINILAGVNGLEAGQTFVVACAILVHNLASLAGAPTAATAAVRDGHLFSAYLMLPLAGTTLALLTFNWCACAGGASGERGGGRGRGRKGGREGALSDGGLWVRMGVHPLLTFINLIFE
jgi:UDP-N-acetylglucosamine--dolichyl-phosphate N-acetylglucosaminephosphotransferase